MIYINKSFDEIDGMNKDGLSILAATEGILTDTIEEKGVYLDDNYNIINWREALKAKKAKRAYPLNRRREQQIKKELAKAAGVNIATIRTFLSQISNNLTTINIAAAKKSKKRYVFTDEEIRYLKLVLKYKYDEKGVLTSMTPKDGWEFLQNNVRLRDIKGYKKVNNNNRTKIKVRFDGKQVTNHLYFPKENLQKIENYLKEL